MKQDDADQLMLAIADHLSSVPSKDLNAIDAQCCIRDLAARLRQMDIDYRDALGDVAYWRDEYNVMAPEDKNP